MMSISDTNAIPRIVHICASDIGFFLPQISRSGLAGCAPSLGAVFHGLRADLGVGVHLEEHFFHCGQRQAEDQQQRGHFQGTVLGTALRPRVLRVIADIAEAAPAGADPSGKEYYYADLGVTWLKGWDETTPEVTDYTPFQLRSDEEAEEKPIPAVCAAAFLAEHGVALGTYLTAWCRLSSTSTARGKSP